MKLKKRWLLVGAAVVLLLAGLAFAGWTTKNRMTTTDHWDIYGELEIQSGGDLIVDGTTVNAESFSACVELDANTVALNALAGSTITSAELTYLIDLTAGDFSVDDSNTVHTNITAIVGALYNLGLPGVGGIDFAGNCAEGDTVTIVARTYGFSAGSTCPAGPDVCVAMGSTVTPTHCSMKFAAALNADSARVVEGVTVSDTVMLVNKTGVAGVSALDVGTSNMTRTATTLLSGRAAGTMQLYALSHTITSAEETTLSDINGVAVLGGVPSTSAPILLSIQAFDANGVQQVLTAGQSKIVQVNSNRYILYFKDVSGTPELVNTDVVKALLLIQP